MRAGTYFSLSVSFSFVKNEWILKECEVEQADDEMVSVISSLK